jgi:hypothetical protein
MTAAGSQREFPVHREPRKQDNLPIRSPSLSPGDQRSTMQLRLPAILITLALACMANARGNKIASRFAMVTLMIAF